MKKLGLIGGTGPELPIPLISIIEPTCQEARRRGFTRIGLLGTIFTMTIHVQALITKIAAEN